ncbi:hypothetical protein [Caulobacter sp. Root655]|uniref:hypothetical protein n=1 Tax=Caulobacter sp. Root655 TaxID=1736578 RepID=UPI0012E39F4D|nr:hypothetical protein [Caulobacter sp. Root655]
MRLPRSGWSIALEAVRERRGHPPAPVSSPIGASARHEGGSPPRRGGDPGPGRTSG